MKEEKEFEIKVLTDLASIKQMLSNYSNVEKNTQEALTKSIENEKRLDKIEDNNNIVVNTWERGCGYTLGCGTGMTASAVIANYLGKINKSVNVTSQGGCVKIDIEDFVYMTGPAVKICEGTLEV